MLNILSNGKGETKKMTHKSQVTNKRVKAFKRKQGGFAYMSEMGLTVAIGAVVLAAAFYAYNKITKTNLSSSVVQAVSSAVSNARNLYSSTGDYDETGTDPNNGLANSATWVNGQLIGRPFKIDGSDVIDPWGNTVTFGASNTLFGFSFGGTGMSTEECVKVAQGLIDLSNQLNVGADATISTAGEVSGGQTVKENASATPSQSALTLGCSEENPKIAVNFR